MRDGEKWNGGLQSEPQLGTNGEIERDISPVANQRSYGGIGLRDAEWGSGGSGAGLFDIAPRRVHPKRCALHREWGRCVGIAVIFCGVVTSVSRQRHGAMRYW